MERNKLANYERYATALKEQLKRIEQIGSVVDATLIADVIELDLQRSTISLGDRTWPVNKDLLTSLRLYLYNALKQELSVAESKLEEIKL